MGTLYDNLSTYQHIERMGTEEVEGLLDGTVVVQPKIDGANATIGWDHKKNGPVICTRNAPVSICSNPPTGFRGLVEYILARPDIWDLAQRWTIRGEWLVKHTLQYPREAYNQFYVFDLQCMDGTYVNPGVYIPMLEERNIHYVPVIATLDHPTLEDIQALVSGPSWLNETRGQKEGVVVKRYDFVNKWGQTTWGKIVASEFGATKEKNHIASTESLELQFAQQAVSVDSVQKIMGKIVDQKGTCTVRDMAQILGVAWHDAWEDHLWDFVKKGHVGSFNFLDAKKNVENEVRAIALEYFNGR
jgi:hypothetical protein